MSVESEIPITEAAFLPVAVDGLPAAPRVRRAPLFRRLPVGRDAIFRSMLAFADLVSAAVGLETLAALAGHRAPAITLCVLPLTLLFATLGGRYDRDELTLRKSTLEELPALLGLAAATTVAWSLIAWIADIRLGLRGGGVAALWGSTAASLVVTRMAARRLATFTTPLERVLIIGSAATRGLLASSLCTDPNARLEVVGFLPLEDERRGDRRDRRDGADWTGPNRRSGSGPDRRRRSRTFEDLERVVRELDVHRVFLIPTSADGELILEAVRGISQLGVKVSLVPRLFEVVGSAVAFDMVGGVTVLGLRRPGLGPVARLCKRAMDVAASGFCLLILSPLIAVVALAIRLDSPGPIFFRQQRMGRDNEVFEILKFRSMVSNAEELVDALQDQNDSTGNFKMANDPRITRVGKLLRRCSVDELPQLINVLKGDMSLVGPRPLILREDRLVEGRHRDRLHLAPGITGPWQVLGPTRPPLAEMVKTDYLYAVNWSIWSDVKLLLRTVAHVAHRRGL